MRSVVVKTKGWRQLAKGARFEICSHDGACLVFIGKKTPPEEVGVVGMEIPISSRQVFDVGDGETAWGQLYGVTSRSVGRVTVRELPGAVSVKSISKRAKVSK